MDKSTLTYKILEYLYHSYGQGYIDLVPFLEKEYGDELPIKWREIASYVGNLDDKIDTDQRSISYIGNKLVHDFKPVIGTNYNGKLNVKLTDAGYDFFIKLTPPPATTSMNVNIGGSFSGNFNQVNGNQNNVDNTFENKSELPKKKDGAVKDVTLKVVGTLIATGLLYLIKVWLT